MNEWSFLCKMSESKKAEFKMTCLHQVTWEGISLRQIELVWIQSFCSEWLNPRWSEFKMAAIIKLSENESVRVRLNKVSESRDLCKMSEFNMVEFSWWLPSSIWVRMNDCSIRWGQLCWDPILSQMWSESVFEVNLRDDKKVSES